MGPYQIVNKNGVFYNVKFDPKEYSIKTLLNIEIE